MYRTACAHVCSDRTSVTPVFAARPGAAFQDNLTYQIHTGKDIFGPELGGYSALCKAHCSKV